MSRPAASARVLIPMKVPPNKTAPMSAPAPLPVHANAIPADCRSNAPVSSVGWEKRELSRAHTAAEGIAAKPTSSHAPVPSRPGECCAMAATRKVPAMMYPMPSRV
ncbi:hypothetical protein A5638_01390 [Mycolicibacterium fortuitum]|nr:hypothetical protein A5638_01390 [Mycolicibacterium fortuitum]